MAKKGIRRAHAAGVIALAALAGSAVAQSGASWSTGDARMMTLVLSSSEAPPPAPVAIGADEMARMFKTLCVDTGGDPAAIDDAAKAAALTAAPVDVSGGKNKPQIQLHLWRGPGMVTAQTDGFFAVREAQCNITFYPTTLPDRDSLNAALTSALGAGPGNAAEAVKSNGKPNKNYEPRWTVAGASAPARAVTAIVMRGNRYTPGDRVLFAARVPAK